MMKKHIGINLFFMGCLPSLSATSYFVATNGDDSDAGTLGKPFVTLQETQSEVVPGDTTYIHGGEYRTREEQVMGGDHLRAYVLEMNESGTQAEKIRYTGYQDERPIFNLAEVRPGDKRVSIFCVSGSYFHFRNSKIAETQVTIREHTQSECIYNQGGNHNIYENLAMYDGMVVGFYLVRGNHNLVLNCDTYNNFDPVSENGTGGNVDDFGGRLASAFYTRNMLKGRQAWYNGDDGFDLIKAQATYTIKGCRAFYNGYKFGGLVDVRDDTGFKTSSYGMHSKVKMPSEIPYHVVKNCLVYKNKNEGSYVDHHLGGTSWFNNIGYQNPSNSCILNRRSPGEVMDVGGYDHIARNNLPYRPRAVRKYTVDVNREECTIINDLFLPVDITVSEDDFVGLDPAQLTLPRKADKSLPDIDLLKLKRNSRLYNARTGFQLSVQNL